eukprot:gene29491-38039_t
MRPRLHFTPAPTPRDESKCVSKKENSRAHSDDGLMDLDDPAALGVELPDIQTNGDIVLVELPGSPVPDTRHESHEMQQSSSPTTWRKSWPWCSLCAAVTADELSVRSGETSFSRRHLNPTARVADDAALQNRTRLQSGSRRTTFTKLTFPWMGLSFLGVSRSQAYTTQHGQGQGLTMSTTSRPSMQSRGNLSSALTRILIVDDSEFLYRVMSRWLVAAGCAVDR